VKTKKIGNWKMKKTERVDIRCTPETKRLLQEIAKDNDKKLSEVIDKAIQEFIQRNVVLF
jgi:predicted transcriptional regulator